MEFKDWLPYISMLGTLVAMYFSMKNGKRTDIKDVEARAAENAKLNVKLDEIARNISEIKEEIRLQKQEVQMLVERMAKVEASAKQAHLRMDRFERKETREDE